MRTIKFRAWDKESKDMLSDVSLWNDDFTNYLNEHIDYLKDTCELMQFTGLLDKNGVEVFEGDVVTIKGDERKFYLRWFDDMCFAFADVRSDYVKTFYSCYDTSNGFPLDEWIEVIGNIYEYHHLLEANHD